MKKSLILGTVLLLAGCQPSDGRVHGYVEGEFIMVSPTSSGLLKTLSVERGQKVRAGDALFSLDLTEQTALRDQAQAGVREAQANLDDLTKGERPEEVEIIFKQKEQAQAELENAQKEYDRVLPLSKAGAASTSKRDNARAALDSAKARMAEIEAQLKAASLGARLDRIEAAKAAVDAAEQALAQAGKKLKDAAPVALEGGIIQDTFYRPGEYVAAGQPVVNLLPPGNVKIRFYVPQAVVPEIEIGQEIGVTCDGCNGSIAARISYVAPQSEYTPPVIYSVESRQKLVFLIEAKPEVFHKELRPGLPVDIDLGLKK